MGYVDGRYNKKEEESGNMCSVAPESTQNYLSVVIRWYQQCPMLARDCVAVVARMDMMLDGLTLC